MPAVTEEIVTIKPLDDQDNKGAIPLVTYNRASGHQDQEHSSSNQEPLSLENQPVNEDSESIKPDIELDQDDEKKVPDGGYGWFIVLGSFLVHVLMGGFERSSGVMYLQLLDHFGMSATETSWVLALFSTLRLCMGPVASALVNRFSIRFVVVLGSIMAMVGVLLSAFTPSLQFMYFSYGILTGCGRAFTYCPCLIIVGYYFNKRRGLAVGLATSGVGIGSFLFPPMIEKMFDIYGFQGCFLILAAVIFNFVISGALFRPLELHQRILSNDRKRKKLKQSLQNGDSRKKLLTDTRVSMGIKDENVLINQNATKMSSSIDITANAKIMSRRPSLFRRKFSQVKLALKGSGSAKENKKPLLELSLFKNYAFSALCIQLLMFTLSFHATFVFLPAIAKDHGLTQIEGAYLLSILGICDAVARIVMSIVLDLKQVKKYRLIIYNFLMIWVGVVSVVIPSMWKFWQFGIVSALYGFMSGTYISQKSVVVVDILGVGSLASSLGLLLLFQGIGSLIGPVIGAVFKDFLGRYDMSFYFGSIGIFSGAIVMATGNIWLYLQRRKKAKAETAEA